MNRATNKIVILLAIIILSACGGDTFLGFFLKNYIGQYQRVEGYGAKQIGEDWLYLGTCSDFAILCKFNNKNVELFNKFAESHGDTAYNRRKLLMVGGEGGYPPVLYPEMIAMGMDIQSIIITSDAEYDNNHPAGTPLNDVIRCVSYTVMEYIRQGYPSDFPAVFAEREGEEVAGVPIDIENYLLSVTHPGYLTRQDKMLTEYTAEDFKLINRYKDGRDCLHPVAIMQFTSLPTLEKEHNLTITITGTDMVDELTFTTTCKFTFE